MKRTIITLTLTLSVLASWALPVKKSEAAVGAIIASPAFMLSGLAIAGVGGTIYVVESILNSSESDLTRFFNAMRSMSAIVFGVVVLDQETNKIGLRELDNKQAAKFNISTEEMTNYNNNLEEINFVSNEVQNELTKINNPTPEDSAKLWDSYKDMIDADAFNVLVKIISSK